MGLVFEWDSRKAAHNLQKHKVSFDEAKTIFGDNDELMIDDPDHSEEETRLISVGTSSRGRILIVSYVEVGPRLRLISCPRGERY